MGLLEGKTAVVTGASRGLGLAIVRELAGEGANVLAVHRGLLDAPDLAALAASSRGRVMALAQDVTATNAPEVILEQARQHFGLADALINNAGRFVLEPFLALDGATWTQVLDTNVTAPFRLMQAFARDLVAVGRGGSIVNIGSIHAKIPDGNLVAQCASKFGLLGLSLSAAEALRHYGVRVNVICPGEIEPDSGHRRSNSPLDRVTQGDVASIAVYLASDASLAITGSTIDAFGASRPVVPVQV